MFYYYFDLACLFLLAETINTLFSINSVFFLHNDIKIWQQYTVVRTSTPMNIGLFKIIDYAKYCLIKCDDIDLFTTVKLDYIYASK